MEEGTEILGGGDDKKSPVDPAKLRAHILKVDAKFKPLQQKRAIKVEEMRKLDYKVEDLGSNRYKQIRPKKQLPKLSSTAYKLCKHIRNNGKCKLGNRCVFAHNVKELNAWNKQLGREIDNTPVPNAIFARHAPRYAPPVSKPPGGKFRLCKHARGPRRNCKMGEKCFFAHSKEELELWKQIM